MKVIYIDAAGSYDTRTDVDRDNIHPNNRGHAHIAKAFLDKIK